MNLIVIVVTVCSISTYTLYDTEEHRYINNIDPVLITEMALSLEIDPPTIHLEPEVQCPIKI